MGFMKNLSEFITPYISPRDNANRCDVRWASLSINMEMASRWQGYSLCPFAPGPYKEEDMEQAGHTHQLPVRELININLDIKVHGVGGNNSLGKRTLQQYTIYGNNPYS